MRAPRDRLRLPGLQWLSVLAVSLVSVAACRDRAAPTAPAARLIVPPPATAPTAVESAAPRLIGGSIEAVAAAPTCGIDGLPECPLQHWMDHHLNGPLSRADFPAVAASFRELASVAPPEMAGWRPWAEGGALAADKRDVPGIERACAGCHDGYRARFRQTMRARALLPVADPP